jgi:hypothetical protein
LQLRGDIPLRGEMLDPLVVEWHDGGLLGMPLRGETLDPLVAEWHDNGISRMPLRREMLDPQVILSGIAVDY